MRLIGFLVRSSAWLLTSAVLTSILGGVLGPVLISLINRALTAPAPELPRLALPFTALSVAMLVLRWVSKTQFVQLSQGTLARLRAFICAEIARTSYRDLERTGTARLLTVLTEDVATLSLFFVMLPRLVMQGAVVAGCLGYLAILSPRAFVFALGTVLVGSVGRYFGSRSATRHLRLALAEEERLFAHFQALFSGAKELRLNQRRRDAFLSSVLDVSAQAVERERVRGERLQVGSMNTGMFLFYVLIGVLVFPIGRDMPDAVRSGYALTLLYMMLPVHALLESIPAIGRARTALERTAAVGVGVGASGELRAAATTGVSRSSAPVALRSIRLDAVTHRYRRETEDGDFLLGPLQLELTPGEVVFLVGGNGSGKTTLAKLLVGLYEPHSGEVHWNGARVVSDTRDAYRQNFAAVFSDYHLFEKLLGLEARQLDERARALLRGLHLEHKVEVRDGVFSTTQLSSGQRKRLALLVAVLEDRPVYVFDEWAADQDPEYKEVFYRQVLPDLKARGKTVFVITHDDRYFPLADRCLRLDAGKLQDLEPASEPRVRAPRGDGPRAVDPVAEGLHLEDGAP